MCHECCRFVEAEGVKLVTDPLSMEFVRGARIVYSSELIKSAFEVILCATDQSIATMFGPYLPL